MGEFPADIYTEPANLDFDTLRNLGPLRPMAGIWEGTKGPFRTDSFRIKVTINPDGTWSYFEDTVLIIPGLEKPFHHTDRNTLFRIAEPTPNPMARGQREETL